MATSSGAEPVASSGYAAPKPQNLAECGTRCLINSVLDVKKIYADLQTLFVLL